MHRVFFVWCPCYCISCIYKATKKSKCMDSLLVYNENHTTKKQDMLNKKAAQYKTMDTAKRQDLLNKKAEQYKTMDTAC